MFSKSVKPYLSSSGRLVHRLVDDDLLASPFDRDNWTTEEKAVLREELRYTRQRLARFVRVSEDAELRRRGYGPDGRPLRARR